MTVGGAHEPRARLALANELRGLLRAIGSHNPNRLIGSHNPNRLTVVELAIADAHHHRGSGWGWVLGA
jgi:hypothetical protein